MREIQKILLVYKEGFDSEAEKIASSEMFEGKKVAVIYHDELESSHVNDFDLVITLGGDGTFVEAANLIEDALILGINSNPNGSEGALTSLDISEIDTIAEVLKGNYNIILRERAEIKLNGKKLDRYALNEFYVGAASVFHSARYVLDYRGKKEEHRSSGVIIASGTGSEAWFKSAGGWGFHYGEKKLGFVVREPYVGKRVFVPTIMKGEINEGESLIFEGKRDEGGIVATGFKVYKFSMGDIVEIKLAEKPLKVVEI